MAPQQMLEAAMLVCFGLAWPLAAMRMLRTRRASGNAATVSLVFCGYLAGMASKLVGLDEQAALAPLFWLYLLNGSSVHGKKLLAGPPTTCGVMRRWPCARSPRSLRSGTTSTASVALGIPGLKPGEKSSPAS